MFRGVVFFFNIWPGTTHESFLLACYANSSSFKVTEHCPCEIKQKTKSEKDTIEVLLTQMYAKKVVYTIMKIVSLM